MSVKPTVCEVFRNMDYKEICLSNKDGEDWLKAYRDLGDKYCGHVWSNNTKLMEDMTEDSWKLILNKFVSLIKEQKDLLKQILNNTLYDSKDAKEIVDVFYGDCIYYLENTSRFYVRAKERVNLKISIRDIYIFGRLLAPLLIGGCNIYIDPLHESIIPYLVAIGNIITNADVPKGVKYIFNTPHDLYPWLLDIGGDYSSSYCPMIIYEESDLDSALECLIESSRRFKGMLYWSVTHVYIQESILNLVVGKLQDISKRIQHIGFVNCEQYQQLKLVNEVVKFLIGWDPRELEIDADLTMSVCLLPFRTIDEVVTLVNSQGYGCAASVWTEKLSVANRLVRLLKIGNIWINSHGCLNPSVPFESISERRVPLNGPQLLEYVTEGINVYPDLFLSLDRSSFTTANNKINKFISRTSIEEAVDYANTGYETLKTLNDKEILQLLHLLPTDVKNTSSIKSFASLDSIYHPTAEMDVLGFSIPCKIAMVTFRYEDDMMIKSFLQVLYHLIAMRTAMICRAPTALLHDISNILPPTWPKGIISLVDINNKFVKCLETEKIGKIIILGRNFAPRHNNPSYNLRTLFSCSKMVWMPTK